MKLEMFVFDIFPHTECFALLEVARADEFSPLGMRLAVARAIPRRAAATCLRSIRHCFLETPGATVEEGV
jgi:UDP-N-acetylglucosamine/UDP-N-acetylgalactosamine diphosphorylase